MSHKIGCSCSACRASDRARQWSKRPSRSAVRRQVRLSTLAGKLGERERLVKPRG